MNCDAKLEFRHFWRNKINTNRRYRRDIELGKWIELKCNQKNHGMNAIVIFFEFDVIQPYTRTHVFGGRKKLVVASLGVHVERWNFGFIHWIRRFSFSKWNAKKAAYQYTLHMFLWHWLSLWLWLWLTIWIMNISLETVKMKYNRQSTQSHTPSALPIAWIYIYIDNIGLVFTQTLFTTKFHSELHVLKRVRKTFFGNPPTHSPFLHCTIVCYNNTVSFGDWTRQLIVVFLISKKIQFFSDHFLLL